MGCQTQLHKGFWHPGKIQRNLMIKFQENIQTGVRGKDGHTLFHKILPAIARGLTTTTEVDWHLKAKFKKYNVGLIKNYHSQHTKNKLNP